MEDTIKYIEALMCEMDGRRERLFYERKKARKERKELVYAAIEALYHQELYGIQIAGKILTYLKRK